MDYHPTSNSDTPVPEDISISDTPENISIAEEMFEPLYLGSRTTICGAYFSIMHFANQNKLSYTAIDHLLDLLRLFCPEPNSLPASFYKFKKFFQQFSSTYEKKTYCIECKRTFDGKNCPQEGCCNSQGKGHLVHIPIDKSLQAIVSSEFLYNAHENSIKYACLIFSYLLYSHFQIIGKNCTIPFQAKFMMDIFMIYGMEKSFTYRQVERGSFQTLNI